MSDSPTAWMLPPFDEYAVAYRDRSAIVPNDEAKSATGGGIFAAIVVVDGQVVGSWKRALGNDGVTVTVESFQDWDATTLEAVQRCAQQYATFLGVPLAGFSSSSGSFSAGR